jgi:heme-degrading monooxygenase HmoA
MSAPQSMVVAISRFTVSLAIARNIEARFARRPRLVDQHPGFLGCEVLMAGGDPVSFVLITRWESRAKLKAYLQSDDFRSVHANSDDGNAEFKVYDLIAC